MKIFVVTSESSPPVFFKKENAKLALEEFWKGISYPHIRMAIEKTVQVRELTIELLMELAPDEFMLTSDGSF